MLVSCFTQFRSELPLLEVDRFFAGPRDRRRSGVDAQARALDRLIRNCEHLRPHLRSPEALEHFIDAQRHPARVRVRISETLAMTCTAPALRGGALFEAPQLNNGCGIVGRRELEAFCSVAQRIPAALVWVFS
jgi:hypothetical protein